MLDIHFIREHPDLVRKSLEKRHEPEKIALLAELLASDKSWRDHKAKAESLRQSRNTLTEQIKIAKAQNQDIAPLLAQAKALPDQIKESELKVTELEARIKEISMRLPNILHESVPFGKDDSENVPIKFWKKEKAKHNPQLTHHGQLITSLGVADFERAVKVAGNGFYYLKGPLALLDMALQRFAMDMLVKKGFTPVAVPHVLRTSVYEGVTDLAEFESVQYKIEGSELRLISTAEHPLAAMYTQENIPVSDLPIHLAGVSPCYRREVGKHGLDERGLFRVHQFNKIEQVVFCTPETSWKEFEQLARNQQELMEALEIPYRVVNVCTGDIGIVAAKKYDLEGWSPREGKYIELGSCSNCTDFQANRLNIKLVHPDGRKEKLHTLNNTMVAIARTLRILIETYQTKKGTILIPKVLQPYMNGLKEITPDWNQSKKPKSSKTKPAKKSPAKKPKPAKKR